MLRRGTQEIKTSENSDFYCKATIFSKLLNTRHKQTDVKAEYPFELVHTDFTSAINPIGKDAFKYVIFCSIWYHLHNLKNVKNTHGGVLLLVISRI